jgi:hypothetical protein
MPKGIKHKDVGDVLTKEEFHAEDAHELAQGTSFPDSPSEGDLFYRTDLHQLYIYSGTEWKCLEKGIGGIAAATQTITSGTVLISGGNLVSISQDASTLGIINALSSATTVSRVESDNVLGPMASRFALEGHQHAGLWRVSVAGNTDGAKSAGAGSICIAGGNNITLSCATGGGGETVSIVGGGGASGLGALANSETTYTSGTIILSEAGNMTITKSVNGANQYFRFSAGGGAGGDGYNIIAASNQTANTTGTVMFSNSNNVSFGMSQNSIITATVTFNQTVQPAVQQLNGSSGTMSIAAGNLMSLSTAASNITLVNVLSSSNTGLDIATVTNAGTLSSRFALADHAHRGLRAYQVQGIASTFFGDQVLSAGSLIALSSGGNSTAGSVAIHNLLSSSATAADVTTATNAGALASRFALADHAHRGVRAYVAQGIASTFFGDQVLSAGSLIALSTGGNTTAGSIAIHNLLSSSNIAQPVSSVTSAGTLSSRFALADHAHAGLWQVSIAGNTVGASTSGAGSICLAGGNNVTLSCATAGGGETISVVAPSPGAAAENNWVNISGNTAGNTTASGSTINWIGGNNITLSGLNNSQIRIDAGGGGGGATGRNAHEIIAGEYLTSVAALTASQLSNKILFSPFWLEAGGLSVNSANLIISGAASSNTVSCVATINIGFYRMNNTSQLTLETSKANAVSFTASADWNGIGVWQATGLGGTNLSEGRWVMAVNVYATATAHMNLRLYGAANMPNFAKWVGAGGTSATGNTSLVFPFWGVYSATTAGLPNSVNLTEIYGGRSADLVDYYAVLKEN